MKRKGTSPKQSKPSKKTKKNPKSKTHQVDGSPIEVVVETKPCDQTETVTEVIAEERQWKNLKLILSLQSKELSEQEKVGLAYSFVKGYGGEDGTDEGEECQAVNISRPIVFLIDWIMSLLISKEKNHSLTGEFDSQPALDFRCWEIFSFCLKQSSILGVSFSLPRNLLNAIRFFTENVLAALNRSLYSEVGFRNGDGFKVYSSVVDCLGLLFSSKSSMSSDNLDLWIPTVEPVLMLTHKVLAENMKDSLGDRYILQFSCLVLEPFSKFLMTHPTTKKNGKNGFRDFLDKLFEPFLDVLGLLNLSEDKHADMERTLLKLIQEILSLALFHSAHIDGFLGLGGAENMVQSYHRHFFIKYENMLFMKEELELNCMGSLFRLFINRVIKQQGDSNQLQEGMTSTASTSGQAERPWKLQDTARNDNESSAKSHCTSALRLETRKSLFDFFLHLMGPILLKVDEYKQSFSEMAPLLADLCCVIKTANSLLFHFAHERIYVKTEDASGGACSVFFKKIFETIVSVASQLKIHYPYNDASEMHVLLAKELVTAIGYLLQIEYEVIESDLVTLWLIILSFLEFSSLSPENSEDDCPLTSLLLGLGCQLINLYSDLRQVSVAVVSLCKAVRLVIPVVTPADGDNDEMIDAGDLPLTTVFPLERSEKSVEKLLSSQDLRHVIHRAIKVIPEGQASGCITSLATDISETMMWVKKVCCSTTAGAQDGPVAAFLAGSLSDIYSLILDSLTITTGNSILVGQSMKDLLDLISPSLTHLVSSDSDCIENFFSAVTEMRLDIIMAKRKRATYRKSVRLFIVFVLRIYMSSRSLYRQVTSLMPPKKQKDMAGIKGDSVAARCGSDWIKEKSWNYEGYFSLISQPSASIVDIIKHISAIYLKGDSADCCLLIYLLYRVTLQRLVDLNRHIKSLDYVSQIHGTMLKHVSVLKREGEELTDFLLGNNIISGFADVGTLEMIEDTDQWILRFSGINRKCLPALRLWILSQHIDLWCPHAGKKKLKNFLSQLIGSSVPSILNGVGMSTPDWENNVDNGTQKKKIRLEQFSLRLLFDSVLYEHEFVRRYLAPSFSHVLKMTAESFFMDFTEEVNFDSPSDWSEALILLEMAIANLPGKLQSEAFLEAHVSQVDNPKFTACQNLLNLLRGMPKEYMNKKSFQLHASYVLDLERFIVFSMLRCLNKLSPGDMQNLFSLFITCRKTLKSIVMVSCDKVLGASKLPLSNSSLLASWLFKSAQAVVTCQVRFRNEFTGKARDALFSLMDHTSYMFLTVSKYQFSKALPLSDKQLISSELSDGAGQGDLIFESLTEQAETLLNALRVTSRDEKTAFECETLILNKLTPIISCFSGLLWGLASAVGHRDMHKNHQNTKLKWKSEQFSKLSRIVYVLSNFIEVFAQCLFLSGDWLREIQTKINWTILFDGTEGSIGMYGDVVETTDVKKKIIESMIKGDTSEKVLALRHLLIASAAILRLNLQIDGITFSPTFVSVLTGISNDLLSEFADMSEVPVEFSFIWLDGAVKVLEELGSQFCLSNPSLYQDLYSKLIELHLKVIGKCISLQGKEATLESHETGFGTNAIHAKQLLLAKNQSHGLHWLDELKQRLRMSFIVFIHSSSELHLFSGVQAIERSLVGVWEECPAIYCIKTGNRDGGRISETAAAGLDCLDLILEHATGRKRLNVVKRHIQGLISAVFGIMAHMQSPFIFFTNAVVGNEGANAPDAGSVILMCVEVLTRIAGKHALFQMDSSHISQSIHIPGAIFRDYLQIIPRVGFSVLDGNLLRQDDEQHDLLGSSKDLQVDQKFSMSLYAACCRLLYTAVKHHKSETEGSIATLQESVSALLYCLESAGYKLGNYDSWEVEEGIRCACFLRRIYEELRQQKEVFGQHCFKFLSSYIWVSSGYGPLKTGLKREVDEALRPGVCALIDSCSPNDLQYLHTVFGEGPCRNSLATLQQDYKLNFKYHGKV